MNEIKLNPIGYVESTRKIPDDDHWAKETSIIKLSSEFSQDVLSGLDLFSHVEIIFYFHEVNKEKIEYSSRHPRNDISLPKMGIFAQRGKNRPNCLGHTICKIKKIENRNLHVENLDAIDGTPVLDIKPWIKEFGPKGSIIQPAWISDLMKNYF